MMIIPIFSMLLILGIWALVRFVIPSEEGPIITPSSNPSHISGGGITSSSSSGGSTSSGSNLENPYELIDWDGSYAYYRSPEVEITLEKIREYKTNIFIADIKFRDGATLQGALAHDKFGSNITENPVELAVRNQAILAVNGDEYAYDKTGVIIRNSTLYRLKPVNKDMMVLFDDGHMEIINQKDMTEEYAESLLSRGATNSYTFGPALIKGGVARTDYSNETLKRKNPRTAVGMIGNNHYVLVVVDGRTYDDLGVTFNELAELMTELGCKDAYNLDGGYTSVMIFNGVRINNITGESRERPVSEIIYIAK